jgi:hypothetical protein
MRMLMTLATQPHAPVTQTIPYSVYPDQPNHSSAPVDFTPFLPPPKARLGAESLRTLLDTLDVDLKTAPAPGATTSEFELARQMVDAFIIGLPPPSPCSWNSPFNADCPEHRERLRSLLLLLLSHPDFQRM